jgi:hypothetical protein
LTLGRPYIVGQPFAFASSYGREQVFQRLLLFLNVAIETALLYPINIYSVCVGAVAKTVRPLEKMFLQ